MDMNLALLSENAKDSDGKGSDIKKVIEINKCSTAGDIETSPITINNKTLDFRYLNYYY
jgi:hypothetical protein